MSQLQAASEQNVSRSYSSSESFQSGNVVSLAANSDETIVLANRSNEGRVIGIVVKPNESLLGIDPDMTKTQVATSGSAQVLVSTLNGTIRIGDKLSVSAVNGVAQKASASETVIGYAKAEFNGSESGTQLNRVDVDGSGPRDIRIGYIELDLSVGAYNSMDTDKQESLNNLQELVRSITGRTISTLRIVASIVIAVLTLLGLAALLYASIYGSIISIGRNPLARSSILRGLTVILVIAGLGVLLAIVTIYLLLR